MVFLIKVYYFLIPFTILSLPVGRTLVSPSVLVSVLIVVMFFIKVMSNGALIFKRSHVKVALLISTFCIMGVISALVSPYSDGAPPKGFIQVMGISMEMGTMLAVASEVIKRPELFIQLARVITVSCTVLAAFGIWQFCDLNYLHVDFGSSWEFMNLWPDIQSVWAYPDYIGPIQRANGFASEPAHYAQFLMIAVGTAWVRLGLCGGQLMRAIGKLNVIPLWVALVIVGGGAISISLVGYGGFLIAAVALALVVGRLFPTRMILLPIAVIVALNSMSSSALMEKLVTLNKLGGEISEVNTEDISVLALGSNLQVAVEVLKTNPMLGVGLGMHPRAYEELAPEWVSLPGFLVGLNSQDGGALLIRLLSETGIAGSAFFIGACSLIVLRALHALHQFRSKYCEWSSDPVFALCAGVFASSVALTIIYGVRMGVYYAPGMWGILTLAATVPILLQWTHISGNKDKGGSST